MGVGNVLRHNYDDVAEEQVWCNCRIAIVGELARHFGRPLIPAENVVEHDHAGDAAGARRASVIALGQIVVMATESHRLSNQTIVSHGDPRLLLG